MDGRDLHDLAIEVAVELPGSVLAFPFGPDWEVVKVVGRMFCLTTASTGEQIVNLKVEPREGRALVEQYANVAPGYHMNKTHWVTIRAEDGVAEGSFIPREEIEELIVSSYLLVIAKMPKKDRPVDPYVYGAAHESRRDAGSR